ncbi:hypothetical protein KLP40_14795 [Hymenobacter sp. NST-14]|uniref:hypothetical protein n=1 Tax=Hymenobacter piscis TaxID=2839984 RepID=UPI001C01272B|nr:hypothetical protein [Hymenobacter piscis]MBT9394437.1 hypothetical protein [Hymenobacter piscis]
MQALFIIFALTLVALFQVYAIRSVSARPVPVTSTRFTLLRAGWALLLGTCCWLMLGSAFVDWVQPHAGLLVLLGVALLVYVENLSRHLLFAFSQQWNVRAVWGMYLASVPGVILYSLDSTPDFSAWTTGLRVLVIFMVLGTLYQRTKRRADRTRWELAGGRYCAQ